MRNPPTHLSFPLSLPPSFFFPSPTASHSPLLLSLFSLARSSLSPAQLYSTGIEMGLSLPGSRRRRECQYYTIAHTHLQRRPRSYHRWECFPCGLMTPLGSGRTHNSTVWCLPPPEEIDPDTPGPGRSLVTLIPQRRGRPTEDPHLADFPCRLCGKRKSRKYF